MPDCSSGKGIWDTPMLLLPYSERMFTIHQSVRGRVDQFLTIKIHSTRLMFSVNSAHFEYKTSYRGSRYHQDIAIAKLKRLTNAIQVIWV